MSDPTNNDELHLFRDMVLQVYDKEIAPHFDQWEHDKLIPRDTWKTLGAAGLLCTDMPEQYGGSGADYTVTQMIIEEAARLGFMGLSTGIGIHSNIVAPYILHLGTEYQKQHWLPKMAAGEAIAALAMTEPGAGSDVQGIRTSAVRDGDEWIINGSKIFITNGIQADLVILACKTDPNAGARGISLILVDTTLPGFKRGKQLKKMGQHSNDTAELFFDDLRVPAEAILGQEGKGFIHMMEELPRERLGCAGQAVAAAQGALEITVDYIQERKAFGQRIGDFQNSRFKVAEAKTEIEINRAFLNQCSREYSEGPLTADTAAMLKLASTEMQCRVIDECLQLFGGYGYMSEYPISRYYVDARVQRIYAGSSEIMKEIVARTLLGKVQAPT
jgi:acyl-CoA dehydrogenase